MLIFLSWGRRPNEGPDIVRMYGDCSAGCPGIHWCRKADGTVVMVSVWDYKAELIHEGDMKPPEEWWKILRRSVTAKRMRVVAENGAFQDSVKAYLSVPSEKNCQAVQRAFDDLEVNP